MVPGVVALCQKKSGTITVACYASLLHMCTAPLQARDILSDVNYFATAAVLCGDADGMVSGATHTTANTIRPALQLLRSHSKQLISSVFFMCLPNKVWGYGLGCVWNMMM